MELHRKKGATLVGQPEGLGKGQRREAGGWTLEEELLSYQEVLGRMKQGPRAKAQGWGSPLSRHAKGAQASGKEANPPWLTSGQREQSPSPALSIYCVLSSCCLPAQ